MSDRERFEAEMLKLLGPNTTPTQNAVYSVAWEVWSVAWQAAQAPVEPFGWVMMWSERIPPKVMGWTQDRDEADRWASDGTRYKSIRLYTTPPADPTPEMIEAGVMAHYGQSSVEEMVTNIYRAMRGIAK